MNYEEAIQSEIKKRETKAIIEKIEKMTDEELYSEAERLKLKKFTQPYILKCGSVIVGEITGDIKWIDESESTQAEETELSKPKKN